MRRPRGRSGILAATLLLLAPVSVSFGQELEPGAYSPAPVGMNIAVTALTFNSGDLTFDPSVPIKDGQADIFLLVAGYIRTVPLAGRAASVALGVPYVHGDLQGTYLGEVQEAHRSGFADPRLRLAVNLSGGPAMTPREFATTPPAPTTLGASLAVSLPLGQYHSERLINLGNNRWGFYPEMGVRHLMGKWTLEGDLGVWFYTDNPNLRGKVRAQEPIGSLQFHAIYTFRPRCWLAFGANYFTGGRTSINGDENDDVQRNSRVGLAFAWPLNPRSSIKFAYSRGAITNIGAAFDSYGIAFQHVWGGK
jgi:hypothetical protein